MSTTTAPPFLKCTPSQKSIYQSQAKVLYTRADILLSDFSVFLSGHSACVALFSEKGYLTKIYSSERYNEILKLEGIQRGTLWKGEGISDNPITAVLRSQTPAVFHEFTVTEDSTHPFTVSVSPIVISETQFDNTDSELICGCVAIFSSGAPYGDYLLTAVSLAREIMLSYWLFNTSTSLSDANINTGVLTVNRSNGEDLIIVCNHSLYSIIGLPGNITLTNTRLNCVIDPPPANKQFWNMIKTITPVKNRSIYLTIRGKRNQYNINVIPYQSVPFHFSGFRLLLTAKKDIYKLVSREFGNNALVTFTDIIGESPSFRQTVQSAKQIAANDSNVLLIGESGVGKDMFAQAIHNDSPRRNKPFIAINCAAIPSDLIASELFGYEPGAFSGARKEGNIGKFELADGGTLFLDEIGDMPYDLQAVLLRAIEQKTFMRVGGTTQISVDVRILTATNSNLSTKILNHQFREDLFYRIGTSIIHIPPLRERPDDIPSLIKYFTKKASGRFHVPMPEISSEALEFLSSLPWKGNVRELQNFVDGFLQTSSAAFWDISSLKRYQQRQILPSIISSSDAFSPVPEPVSSNAPAQTGSVKAVMPDSRQLIEETLARNHFHRGKTAAELGISRTTLYRRMREYGIEQ